jgi:hypothetical protein
MAIEFIAKLNAGSTVRKLTGGGAKLGPAMVSYERFKKHCELHPEWAAEAWRISKVNTSIGKGALNRNLAHCRYGHSLADALVTYQAGYIKRDCRTCQCIRHKRAPAIDPSVAKKVEVLLRRGVSVSSFTSGRSKSYLVQHKTFTRFRLENPEINDLFLANLRDANSRAQKHRHLKAKNEAKREEANDYRRILAMLPERFPDKDDVVSAIFADLFSGALKREDVRKRVQTYIAAHNRMFPTNYAKFGNSPLVSLDEVLFEDGSTTRGDTVSRGLWD